MLSDIASRFVNDARYAGPLPKASVAGTVGEVGGGPYMILELDISDDGRVRGAAYQTFGCPSAMACGSLVCHIAQGKHVEHLDCITKSDILIVLGGLPEGKDYCADLAIGSLQLAIKQYKLQREPDNGK